MFYRIKLIIILILFSGPLLCSALARPAPWIRKEHADKNDDGIVDRKEKRIERNWERKQKIEANQEWKKKADRNNDGVIDNKEVRVSWKYKLFSVNNRFEEKYDYDNNGWLSPDESEDLLEHKKSIIQSNGKAKVDTAVERLYDSNNDGIIDTDELEEIKEDFD